MPAVLKSGQEQQLYPPVSGQFVSHELREGKSVKKGDELATFSSPQLDSEIKLSKLRKRLLEVRLSRANSNTRDLSAIEILKRELQAESEHLSGLERKYRDLTLVAPFSGVLANVDDALHTQIWVSDNAAMSMLHAPSKVHLSGYVTGDGFRRLEANAKGKFIPDGFFAEAIDVQLIELAPVSSASLKQEILGDTEGGHIPVRFELETMKPLGVWFRLEMKTAGENSVTSLSNIQRGLVVLEGKAESYFTRVSRRVLGVLIRESGF